MNQEAKKGDILEIQAENTEIVCINIRIRKGAKRSWRWFRDWTKKHYGHTMDCRKSKENVIPLLVQLDCDKCGKNILEVRKPKDFPLKDKKCKCGKGYLIKWDILPTSKTTHAHTIN